MDDTMMTGMMGDTTGMRGAPKMAGPNVALAREWLNKAIARHERHLSGEEPTDPASQEEMMLEMEEALIALGPDDAPTRGMGGGMMGMMGT
jgi:hypothetical protein